MKTSEVLREAAKLLEQQMFVVRDSRRMGSCGAIHKAINDDSSYDLQDKASARLRSVAWGTDYLGVYWFGRPIFDDCQNHRIVALCLAAAIAESEGD